VQRLCPSSGVLKLCKLCELCEGGERTAGQQAAGAGTGTGTGAGTTRRMQVIEVGLASGCSLLAPCLLIMRREDRAGRVQKQMQRASASQPIRRRRAWQPCHDERV
jgi:hypothetical protein